MLSRTFFPRLGLFPGKIDKIQTHPVSQAAFRLIARPLIVFHVLSADGVNELNWLSSSGSLSWILEWVALSATAAFSLF